MAVIKSDEVKKTVFKKTQLFFYFSNLKVECTLELCLTAQWCDLLNQSDQQSFITCCSFELNLLLNTQRCVSLLCAGIFCAECVHSVSSGILSLHF